jgi:hydroxymethylpyrimidine pyrophosphatase-like HAD family hydrolase
MTIVFDIDNTILYSEVDAKGNYHLEGFDIELRDKINYLHNKGHKIILWTGRHWNHLEITQKQLAEINLSYDTLIMGKPYAEKYYVDDKAILPKDFLKEQI